MLPFLLAEILNFQGSTHRIGVGSFSIKKIYGGGRMFFENVVLRLGSRFGLSVSRIIAEYQQIEAKLGYSSFSTTGPGGKSGIGKRRQLEFRSRLSAGNSIDLLIVDDSSVVFSARIVDFVSSDEPILCPWGADSVPTVFGGGAERNRTWFKIVGLQPCRRTTSNLFFDGGSGKSLATVLANSQFIFGYVH